MSAVLGRAMSEYPRVSQADILSLLETLSQMTPKEHMKLFKGEAKALSGPSSSARLDVSGCRLDRGGVIPCKTTIETIKLTNPHRSAVHWKLLKPAQVSTQYFLSCTPISGTLEKGKSVEIRVCCVLLTYQPVLDFLTVACSLPDQPQQTFLPIMLRVSANTEGSREPYWSVDFSELVFRPSAGAVSAATSGSASYLYASQAGRGSFPTLATFNDAIPSSSSSPSNTVHSHAGNSPTSHSPSVGQSILGGASPSSLNRSSPLSRSDSPLAKSFAPGGASSMPTSPSPMSSSFPSLPIVDTAAETPISAGPAELYGMKVYVRRWLIDQHDLPPQACLDEIEALRSLRHPNLVTFIGARAELGQAYTITKLIEGGPFETYLKYPKGDAALYSGASGGGAMLSSILKRMEMLLDIAYAMAFLHGKGLVHRHLSSSIMMMDEKHLKLSDCGQSANSSIPITCYIAPEVFADSSQASTASDIFSFGICLWEAACGTKPVRAGTDLAQGTVPALSCDTTMLPDLVELIQLCCAKDPSARPNFSTVINEIEAMRDTAAKRTAFHFVLSRNKTIKDRQLSSFPSSLVYLDMSSNVHLTDRCVPELPRNLVHLDLQMCPNFTDDSIQFLPATLNYLDLSSATKLTNAAIPALPRVLTWLSLRDNTNLTAECLAYLPTDLVNLNILNSSKLSEKCLEQLPKTLTDLTMPCAWIPAFKDEYVKLLPPKLTTIHFPTNTSLTAAGIEALPATVRHLNLAANASLASSGLSVLPPHLESLNIAAAVSINDDALQFLPKSLKHLNLSRNKNIGHLGVRVLSQNLLTLNVSATQNIQDMTIRSLPRSLTTLNLAGNKMLTDAAIRDMPISLTELNLAANTHLTDACVKHFPASLKILNLYWNVHFTDASIKLLPRSLIELNLSSNTNFTDACTADFPRSLRVLYLRKCANFTDASIKYMPRSLTHLDLSASKDLTDECIADLPTGLITLEIWKNKNLSQDNIRARLPSMRVLALNMD